MSYKAIIARLDKVTSIPEAHSICLGEIIGNSVVVGKDYLEGMIGVYFPCDGILSQEFCKANNLFPILDKNGKRIGGGYFDLDRPRVRAQKFRKSRSMGFFIGLDSLKFTGFDLSKLKIGDVFDTLNDIPICTKYINPATLRALQGGKKSKKQPVAPLFFEHRDTDQFDYYGKDIQLGALITLENKKHGTSGRYSYTKVCISLPFWKRWINKLVPIFPEYKNEYLVGTRRVVLLPEDENKEGFHGSEGFRYKFLEKIKGKIPLNMTIYLEICGWANGSPIMSPHSLDKNDLKELKYSNPMFFSYGNIEGECDYSIYRITLSGDNGDQYDLSWDQIKAFCKKNGLKHVLELEPSFIYDGDFNKLKEKIYSYLDKSDPEDNRHVSEGIVLRADYGGITTFYKKKGFYFLCGEGLIKDSGAVDLEEAS